MNEMIVHFACPPLLFNSVTVKYPLITVCLKNGTFKYVLAAGGGLGTYGKPVY